MQTFMMDSHLHKLPSIIKVSIFQFIKKSVCIFEKLPSIIKVSIFQFIKKGVCIFEKITINHKG